MTQKGACCGKQVMLYLNTGIWKALGQGLADNSTVDALHITWPDGQQQVVPVPRIDVMMSINQPGPP